MMEDRQPDRSAEGIAVRKALTDKARAMIARAGYQYDLDLEAATEAFVAGDLSHAEYRARALLITRFKGSDRGRPRHFRVVRSVGRSRKD